MIREMNFFLETSLILASVCGVLWNPLPGHAQGFLPADSLRLNLVFPTGGDTLNFDRVRYAGSALPGAKVRVQGQEPKVYPSGAFVGMVRLQAGHNKVVFTAEDSFGIVSDTVDVFREPAKVSLPQTPTAMSPNTVKPSADVYVSPGELLDVEFMGSPGGTATFSIDGMAKNVRLMEERPRNAHGLKGIYQASILVPSLVAYKPKPVEFRFRGRDGRRLKFKSKGRIHVLSPALLLIGVTTDSINLVLTEPDGEIWMELPQDIKVQITGERDGIRKVQLAENVTGYIASSSLKTLPVGTPFPRASVGSIATLWDRDWIQVRINISERVPFRIEQMLESSALEVTFYRARQAPQWITYPKDDETIRLIRWRQESSDIFVLRIDLNQKQQWGYYGRYVGKQFWLNIRKTPQISTAPGSPLRGLTITVDAGHGGEFEGAVGPTGLYEKDVNLQLAKTVAAMLEAAGAQVLMTRMSDTTVTLRDRIKIARSANSHIFVSLHNNSIGPATNPLRPRGTSTYHTVPQSEAVARSVYNRMLELGLSPFGRVLSTYFVTRQTSLISFLVESVFITHPEDELLLLDESFLQEMAGAVVNGIKDFVVDKMPADSKTDSMETDGSEPAEPDTLRYWRD